MLPDEHPPLSDAVKRTLHRPPAPAVPVEARLLLTVEQAAQMLGMSAKTLMRYAGKDGFPAPVNPTGDMPRFRRSDLVKWVEGLK